MSTFSDSNTSHELAQIVQHNLTHHHLWTGLQLETLTIRSSPDPTITDGEKYTLCTGVPREQLHPDDVPLQLNNDNESGNSSYRREWVLPVKTDQQWSIREWAEMFAAIEKIDSNVPRIVMAAVTNDGTVVYYFVNRGITKPRKN